MKEPQFSQKMKSKPKTNPVFLTMKPGESWENFKARATRSLMDHAQSPKKSGINSTKAKVTRGDTTGTGNIKAGDITQMQMKTHKPKKVHPTGKPRPSVQSPAAVKTYQPKFRPNWREMEKEWEKDHPGEEIDPDPEESEDESIPTPQHVIDVLGFDPQEEADIEANSAKGKAKRKREIDGGVGCPACGTNWMLHDVDEESLVLGDKCPECDKAALVPLRNIADTTGK